MNLRFLTAKQKGLFKYCGHSYALDPIGYPEVDLRNILVADDRISRTICRENPDTMQAVSFDAHRLPGFPEKLAIPPGEIPADARLMLVRGGGIGDIIMLGPALKKLRQTVRQGVSISLATFGERMPLFRDLGYIDRFFPYPIRLSDFMGETDYYVDFSDTNGTFNTSNMIDFYLDALSLDPSAIPPSGKVPEISDGLRGSKRMKRLIRSACPEGKTKVFFSGMASDRLRFIPPDILETLAGAFPDMVFIRPEAGKVTGNQGGNIVGIDTSGTLADYVTAIDQCDILVSADSSAYHIAAALKVPSLVLFGPIDSRIRTGYYPLAVALDSAYSGHTCHAPCGISVLMETTPSIPIGREGVTELREGMEITTFTGETFRFDPARGCPEANVLKSPYSPCLSSIPHGTVVDSFRKVLSLPRRQARP